MNSPHETNFDAAVNFKENFNRNLIYFFLEVFIVVYFNHYLIKNWFIQNIVKKVINNSVIINSMNFSRK